MEIKKKNWQDKIEDLDHLILMIKEEENCNKPITAKTKNFFRFIDNQLDENNLFLGENDKFIINQFLYLINANYYKKIKEDFNINREDLIKRIIGSFIIYLEKNKKKSLKEQDIEKISNSLFYIKEDLRKKIVVEFENSEIIIGGKSFFLIEENSDDDNYFDYESTDNYQTLIAIACDNEYLKTFGNPWIIDWDIYFLKDIMKVILEQFQNDIIQCNENYSEIGFVGSFIFNVLNYALVNQKEHIGEMEIINTFKYWEYLDFELKANILNTIFEKFGIDSSKYHFFPKKVLRQRKIINFRQK